MKYKLLKLKEAKWKEFCKNCGAFGFARIAPDAYVAEFPNYAVRVSKRGGYDICFVTHTEEATGRIIIHEDYEFKNGFPKCVIGLIEAGYVQFPELKV